MLRPLAWIVLAYIIMGLLFSASLHGQTIMKSEMCDLYIGPQGHEVRVTWPPTTMPGDECMKLLQTFLPKIKKGTSIFCQCIEGSAQS